MNAKQISEAIGVTEDYAKKIQQSADSLPQVCAVCGNETQHYYLLRLADAESSKYLGKPTHSGLCRVAVRRFCLSCQADLGELGMQEHIKSQSLSAGVYRLA